MRKLTKAEKLTADELCRKKLKCSACGGDHARFDCRSEIIGNGRPDPGPRPFDEEAFKAVSYERFSMYGGISADMADEYYKRLREDGYVEE